MNLDLPITNFLILHDPGLSRSSFSTRSLLLAAAQLSPPQNRTLIIRPVSKQEDLQRTLALAQTAQKQLEETTQRALLAPEVLEMPTVVDLKRPPLFELLRSPHIQKQ